MFLLKKLRPKRSRVVRLLITTQSGVEYFP